jgi:hypothetical protein
MAAASERSATYTPARCLRVFGMMHLAIQADLPRAAGNRGGRLPVDGSVCAVREGRIADEEFFRSAVVSQSPTFRKVGPSCAAAD